jgi:hypothetical protein
VLRSGTWSRGAETMVEDEGADKSNEPEERPIDRVRKLAEEAGVPWKETTRPGRRTIVFGARSSSRRRGGKKTS